MSMGIRRRRAVFIELRAGAFFGGHSGARQGKEARIVGTVRGGKGAVTIDVFKTLVLSFGSTPETTKKHEQKNRGHKAEKDKRKKKKKTRGR